jgi:hypothetical protein
MKHDGYYASIIYPQRKESHWSDTNEVVNSTKLILTVAEIVNRKISKREYCSQQSWMWLLKFKGYLNM